MKKKRKRKKDVDTIRQKIKSIVDNYLKDHYGVLGERSDNHNYTRELVELLMMKAYNANYL